MERFKDFTSAVEAMYEMVKIVEASYGGDVYIEDAYLILDHLKTFDYSKVGDTPFSIYGDEYLYLKYFIFYDIPRHRTEDKLYDSFAKAYMPKMSLKEQAEHYPEYANYENPRVEALRWVVKSFLRNGTITKTI